MYMNNRIWTLTPAVNWHLVNQNVQENCHNANTKKLIRKSRYEFMFVIQVSSFLQWIMNQYYFVTTQYPEYDHLADGIPNDIAIIRLAEPVDLTNQYVGVIGLPEEDEDFVGNSDCWIMGWGMTSKL